MMAWQQKPLLLWGVGVTVLHVLLAATSGLSADEAHYALYAQFPAWSYFDHPPLVGWVQIPFLWLAQYSNTSADVWLRLLPMSLWLITAYGVHRLYQEWYGAVPTHWLMALLSGGLMWHLLGVGLVPDTLLMALLPWLVLVVWRLGVQPRWGLWLAAGALLGLMALAKYTMVFFAFSALWWLWWQRGTRPLFSAIGFYVATALMLLATTPVWWWNYQHDWVSFIYQLQHGTGQTWQIKRVIRSIGANLLSYGVFTVVLVLWSLSRPRWHLYNQQERDGQTNIRRRAWQCALVFSVPFLLVMFYLAGSSFALPHWTAPPWLILLPQAVYFLRQHLHVAKPQSVRWWRYALVFQCLLVLIAFVLSIRGGVWSEVAAPKDHSPPELNPATAGQRERNTMPFADIYGWQQAAAKANQIMLAEKQTNIVMEHWVLASRMAWYARSANVAVVDQKNQQFGLWYQGLQKGEGGILVTWSQNPRTLPVGETQFKACEWRDAFITKRLGLRLSRFDYYLCTDWQGAAF